VLSSEKNHTYTKKILFCHQLFILLRVFHGLMQL